MNDVPKFLVEWSSPWEEFKTAIGPALGRSPERLAGEAPTGLFPYRGILISWVLEAFLLIAAIIIPTKLASMRPSLPPPMPKYDVIYFSGDELPRTQDVGGAQSGRSGRSGGKEAHHRTQTIRVARGNSLRDTVVDAPKLNLPVSDSAVANLLAFKPVPGPAPAEGLASSRHTPALSATAVAPSPDVQRDNLRTAPTLTSGVVAPTPDVQRDKLRGAPSLSTSVVPPSPNAPQKNLAALRLPGSQVTEVVPPPVSAPAQATNLNPRLALPAPNVVAPPPTVTHEVAALGPGYGPGELHKQVVPPPVQLGGSSAESRAVLGPGSEGIGTVAVVPPPAQIGAGGSGQRRGTAGLPGGGAVVPPPPSVAGTNSIGGQGRGNRGAGLGGPLDVGSVAAPANSGGSNAGTGVVVSSQPGSKVGAPGSGGAGALAMSPSGGAKPGLGGSGGGSGIGRGDGPGGGFAGEGPGAGKEGVGHGSDTTARGGISPYPGPGGAGTAPGGKPVMPGVSVEGGTNTVTLPSFANGGDPPSDPGRSSKGKRKTGFEATVVATSRSGGALNFYGVLKGNVYTNYIDTAAGTVVMEFADPASAEHPYAETLVAPEVLRKDLPTGLPKARLVIVGNLDTAGLLRDLRVYEAGPALMTSKILAALVHWKFTPVLRGDQPVEVRTILGFNIDTNDRF